jgi:hypothetical protein
MKAMTFKYSDASDRLACAMPRAQALRLKNLAEEAYQPEKYATDLSFVGLPPFWPQMWPATAD